MIERWGSGSGGMSLIDCLKLWCTLTGSLCGEAKPQLRADFTFRVWRRHLFPVCLNCSFFSIRYPPLVVFPRFLLTSVQICKGTPVYFNFELKKNKNKKNIIFDTSLWRKNTTKKNILQSIPPSGFHVMSRECRNANTDGITAIKWYSIRDITSMQHFMFVIKSLLIVCNCRDFVLYLLLDWLARGQDFFSSLQTKPCKHGGCVGQDIVTWGIQT